MQLEIGSTSRPGTGVLPEAMEGPLASRMTRLSWLPVMMKPPMRMLSPVNTWARVEMLSN